MTQTLDEVRKQRRELDEKFESGLPDHLINYFDDEESKLLEDAYKEELGEETEFWKSNKGKLVKVKRKVRKDMKAKYKEPPLAEERLEQEKDLSSEKKAALIKLCEKNLYIFAVTYFPHYLKLPSSKLHKFLYNLLTEENNKERNEGFKLAVAAPRGNAKSTLISTIYPLWNICFNKKKFMLVVSDTQGQAIDFLSDIKREIDNNLKLRHDFPHIIGKGPTWKSDEVITANEIKILALGTGSKVLGRRFGVHRPDLIILDDLENPEMVRSKTTREYIRYEWFNKSLLYVGGEEGAITDFLYVGTIQGEEALLNAIINKGEYPDWRSKKFQAVNAFSTSDLWNEWEVLYTDRFDVDRKNTAEKFFEDNKEEMLKGTEVLWPEGDPYYRLMVNRLSDESAFCSEKQNDPLDKSKLLVSIDDLHFEDFKNDYRLANLIKYNTPRIICVGALDPSLGKDSSSDYYCITTVKQDKRTGYLYVVDFNIARKSVDQQIEEILKSHIEFDYNKFACETNAFQIVLADNLRKRSREEALYIPIEDMQNYRDKHMRLESIVPIIKDGTIVFDSYKLKTNRMYAFAIDMITKYTENASHDDAFDSLEMAIRLCKVKQFKRIFLKNR